MLHKYGEIIFPFGSDTGSKGRVGLFSYMILKIIVNLVKH